MIHSSSATIGIVMGLGAAGVLDWTDGRRLLARRRPRHHDHLLDGLAQPVEERQARGLCAHLLQHHRRCVIVPLFFLAIEVLQMGDAVLRRRSGRAGDGRRQGDLPAGAGRRRPLLDRLQRLQHAAAVSLRRHVRAGAVAGRPHRRRKTSRTIRRRNFSTASSPATSPRPCPPCSRRPRGTCRPAPCSSTSRAARRTAPVRSRRALSGDRHPEPRHPHLHGLV